MATTLDEPQTRELLLRLRHLPPEMTQRILIEVPLPQLLEICGRVASFAGYCQDRNFWLARAQARYQITAERFVKAETVKGSTKIVPGPVAYLNLVHSYLHSKSQRLATKHEAAKGELADLTAVVMALLRQRAQEKSGDPITYYAIDHTEVSECQVDVGVLFPAASSAEALLSINDYLKRYDIDIISNQVDTELGVYLDDAKHDDDYTGIEPITHLVESLFGGVIGVFEEGEMLNYTTYQQIRPRYV